MGYPDRVIGPDGLRLGPLALSWPSLTLLLGLVAWAALARFPGAGRAALVTLITARLWAAVPGLDAGQPLLDNALDLVDVRRGDWAWLPGLAAGMLSLAVGPRGHGQVAARAVLVAVLAGALPGLLRPAGGGETGWPDTPLRTLRPSGQLEPATPVPPGRVVNLWATWCGPCRAELPLLEREIARGAPVELVNVGEAPAVVVAFLRRENLVLPTRVGGEALTPALKVTAFPTTLVVDAGGRVTARHLGPLNRAQLLRLVRAAQGPAASP